MLTAHLSGSATDTESCIKELRLPAATCAELLKQAGGDPNMYYALARAAIVGYGTKACASYVSSQTGIPPAAVTGACAWAIDNIAKLIENAPSIGGPTYKSLYAGTGAKEGVFWYESDDPDPGPGEHWIPAHGGTPSRRELNIAILDKEGEPRRIVYIPCHRMHETVEGHVRCRDVDGVMRATGTQRPLYRTGFYGERVQGAWPGEYEHKAWSPPMTLEEKKRALISARGPYVDPAEQRQTTIYPHGTVTAWDDKVSLWRIAAPVSGLSGDSAYRELTPSSAQPAGVSVVPITDLLRRTGQLPWYKDWRVWGVAGAVAGGGATFLLWKRRKRRKRR